MCLFIKNKNILEVEETQLKNKSALGVKNSPKKNVMIFDPKDGNIYSIKRDDTIKKEIVISEFLSLTINDLFEESIKQEHPLFE